MCGKQKKEIQVGYKIARFFPPKIVHAKTLSLQEERKKGNEFAVKLDSLRQRESAKRGPHNPPM